jgi:WD40 repeat protein
MGFWNWCRRNPATAGILALFVLAAVGGTALAMLNHYRQRQAEEEARNLAAHRLAQLKLHPSGPVDTYGNDTALDGDSIEKLKKELLAAEAKRREYQVLATTLTLNQGLFFCDNGDPVQGLLWLARSFEIAPSDDTELRHYLRVSLAGWQRTLTPLRAMLPHKSRFVEVRLSPDGKVLATRWESAARLWDPFTGQPLCEKMPHEKDLGPFAFHPDGKVLFTANAEMDAGRFWEVPAGKPIGQPIPHPDGLDLIAFSPDGKLLAGTSLRGGKAQLWEAPAGKPVGPPLAHQDRIQALAFSPDGKLLATGGRDKLVQLWSAADGKPAAPPLKHDNAVEAVAFSPTSKALASLTRDGVFLWDVPAGKPLARALPHDRPEIPFIFHPQGTMLATVRGESVELFETTKGEPLRSIKHEGGILGLLFTPDGKALLTAGNDRLVQRWNPQDGASIGTPLLHPAPLQRMHLSSDGKTIVTVSDTVRRWDAETGQALTPLARHHPAGRFVEVSRDGLTLITQSDVERGGILVWDGNRNNPLSFLTPHNLAGRGVRQTPLFSRDGKLAVTINATAGLVQVWDAATGQPKGEPFKHDRVKAVALGGEDKLLATAGDKVVRLWDLTTGKLKGEPFALDSEINTVALHPDGSRLLAGCQDKLVRLWDVATGKPSPVALTHEHPLALAIYSADGKFVATADTGKTVRLWQSASGQPTVATLAHDDALTDLAFSPDGKLLATASADQTARLWDTTTGKLVGKPLAHQNSVESVTFSNDGRRLVTASADRTAKVWLVPDGTLAATLTGRNFLTAATFLGKGEIVAGGGLDNVMRFWDVAAGRPVGPVFTHPAGVLSVIPQPGGRLIATACADGAARFWLAPQAMPEEPERIRLWIELATAQTLDPRTHAMRALESTQWQERKERLDKLGGAP